MLTLGESFELANVLPLPGVIVKAWSLMVDSWVLLCVELCSPEIHVGILTLVSQKVTSFGNKVVAEVISYDNVILDGVGLNLI